MVLIDSSPGLYHCLSPASSVCLSFPFTHLTQKESTHGLTWHFAGLDGQHRGLGAQRPGRGKAGGLAQAFVAGTHASSPEPAWLVFLLKQRFKL